MSKLLRGWAVLVVDDDDDTVQILEYLISKVGGQVRSARSAREALEHVRRARLQAVRCGAIDCARRRARGEKLERPADVAFDRPELL